MHHKNQNLKIIKLILAIFLLVICHTAKADLAENNLLTVDQAFIFQAQVVEKRELELYWQIAPGYYLYQNQLKLIDADNHSLLSDKVLPTGTHVNDPVLGDHTLYSIRLTMNIPWSDSFIDNSLILTYQGCSQTGFCYAPVNKRLYIHANNKIEVLDTSEQGFPVSQIDTLANSIKTEVLPLTLIIFFGLGLLLAFSPCVLPMIPLVANLIIGNEVISKYKACVLACCYVIGMAGTYAIAGIVSGLLGASLHVWLQNPLVLTSFSLALIFTALHQLGIIKISLPHFNKELHGIGQKISPGSMFGSFMLGFISALIVSPCITPPLIGVLTYIGQNGSPLIGGLTLFSLGLGMGLPLIAVALLSSAILPITGAWMNVIKNAAGIALICLALWLLQGLIPNDFISKNSQWQNVAKIDDLHKYLAQAKNQHRPAIVEFYASWCASCRKIEQSVFIDPQIKTKLSNFVLLRVDLTNLNEELKTLTNSLHVYGPPTILFYDSNGAELSSKRIVGTVDIETMLKLTSD